MDIFPIQEAIRQGQIFFTEHAVRQMANRDITDVEIIEALLSGKIIEEYPDDKYSPSCLIFGLSQQQRPLHIVCCLPPRVRIITVYEPDLAEWIDYIRRKP